MELLLRAYDDNYRNRKKGESDGCSYEGEGLLP